MFLSVGHRAQFGTLPAVDEKTVRVSPARFSDNTEGQYRTVQSISAYVAP